MGDGISTPDLRLVLLLSSFSFFIFPLKKSLYYFGIKATTSGEKLENALNEMKISIPSESLIVELKLWLIVFDRRVSVCL